MPDNVRAYLSSIARANSMHDLKDKDSVVWIHSHIIIGRDQDLKECIDKLMSSLALLGDKIHGGDVASILANSFFALWNKEDFNLDNSIRDSAIYWRQHSTPPARVSLDGLNRISWTWKLEVESREYGVLHVGIDEKKRTLLCYEYPVGLYFPEGEIMERIYREIVQDQDMAGQLIGVGRKQVDAPTGRANFFL